MRSVVVMTGGGGEGKREGGSGTEIYPVRPLIHVCGGRGGGGGVPCLTASLSTAGEEVRTARALK